MLKNVLIADDSAIARSIIKRVLEIAGFEDLQILEAGDGIEALEKLKSVSCDLVFTDLNMPNMDGLQLLRRIKASPKLNETPVVVISSVCSTMNKADLISKGAMEVFKKPVSMPDICQFLMEYKKQLMETS